MEFSCALRDGETLAHTELMVQFGYKNEQRFKELVARLDVPYYSVRGVWWIAVEDLREAMRQNSLTHKQRKQERASQ